MKVVMFVMMEGGVGEKVKQVGDASPG